MEYMLGVAESLLPWLAACVTLSSGGECGQGMSFSLFAWSIHVDDAWISDVRVLLF